MSRLDQLAKPRKKPSADLPSVFESKTLLNPKRSSVTRSMSHLAVSKQTQIQPQKPLSKTDSRSMHQLSAPAPLPPPRTTRATQLRQQKLAVNQQPEGKWVYFIYPSDNFG